MNVEGKVSERTHGDTVDEQKTEEHGGRDAHSLQMCHRSHQLGYLMEFSPAMLVCCGVSVCEYETKSIRSF